MNDHGMPPAGSAARSDDVPLWMIVTVAALLVAITAVFVVVLTQQPTPASQQASSAVAAPPPHPTRWDRRIAPYARIAAKKRGLRFTHPVTVRFLPSARFEKTLTKERSELSAKDRTEIEHATGLMRAFGMLDGDVDLFDATNDATSGGVLAYYSFDDQRITIRGRRLTPAVRSTLVHELTHALQDQHFAIGARMKKLDAAADHGASTSVASVLTALVEGDAQRVEGLYRDSLPAAQRKALDSGTADQNAAADQELDQVPTIVVTLMVSPYVLGQALVQTVAADGGNAAVDDLLTAPPAHESALLDPFRVLAGDRDAVPVAAPSLEKGEKKFDSGEFGVVSWYLMLAERLPLREALAVADGWGGDAYVAFERKGTSCARAAYVGRNAAATRRMGSALTRWVAAAPGSSASVSSGGGSVHFESCDPGASVAAGKDSSTDALKLVSVRAHLALGALKAGAPADEARCIAGRMVGAYRMHDLADPSFGADDPVVQARVRGFVDSCRS